MYTVCFMSETGRYHKRFCGLRVGDMLWLISLYRWIVPHILVTDSSEKTVAEIKNGQPQNAREFAVVLEEIGTQMTPKKCIESVEDLFLTYQKSVVRYTENRDKKVEMMIAEKDLLAVAAKDDIDLLSMGYRDIDQVIDEVERPW